MKKIETFLYPKLERMSSEIKKNDTIRMYFGLMSNK